MDTKTTQSGQRNRFLKLSLKKTRPKANQGNKQEMNKLNRSSDVIILDESFDKLRSDFQRTKQNPKTYSPIVINDSCELSFSDDLPKVILNGKEPSKSGNISFNCSRENVSPTTESRPSIGGWSPAQSILCATPRHEPTPSTPKDIHNESQEQCSIKKIHQSQKKLLDDLYGETWKSIPKLFKAIKTNYENYNTVSKKLRYDDDESDKENIRSDLKRNKMLYLTDSERKKAVELTDTEKKSKKKLYTEKVPSTPEVPKVKVRNVNSTTKKNKVNKAMSVTEMVETMRNDVDLLAKKVGGVNLTPNVEVSRISFVGSLADNVPSWRCHVEAIQYRDNYKTLREQLARRLYVEFNKGVFDDALDADMPILWDTKLRTTAGTTTNRLIKNSKGDRIRSSSIKLSTKVLDGPQRLRDTLIHEMCHAATWLIDSELRAGHGPLWNKWAKRALRVYPELGEISRCHDMEIHFKYSYKCTKCGYSVQRHSKSIDVTKKCCGYCKGTFELILNKKNKDGVVVSTPARKGTTNEFALYVKENYAALKDGTRNHGQVMKILGEQFAKSKGT
ncbi:acidic repeat-containing protein [Trichoplusia ni]|uniref:Acidic repeat-containing protein n=1 Tax=Trichoplusia ni TaxID=7111 RepID=A0A7E5VZZ7_TRINI|nr:acidic repeat-containing protein [Trichoplusia ni]